MRKTDYSDMMVRYPRHSQCSLRCHPFPCDCSRTKGQKLLWVATSFADSATIRHCIELDLSVVVN